MSETREGVQNILAGMDEQNERELRTGKPGNEAANGIQDIYVLIVREREAAADNIQVVDSTPSLPQKTLFLPAYAICGLYLFCILGCIVIQVYGLFNPPIATVTIIPTSLHVTRSGTLQLGRILYPLTLSQSQTVPTTGTGHQDAKQAHGTITFYNGQFQHVIITAGTVLTGASGVQVVTDQDASIPAGNPPSYGQVTVSAHALVSGTRGNIPAYDINQACCAVSVLATITQPWTGGQDERDFHTVAQRDIGTAAIPLQSTLAHSIAGVFQAQLQPNEHLHLLPCAPAVTTDHPPGAEATQVHVTVSKTCSAVAYDKDALQAQATAFLTTQAATSLGTGYRLVGDVHVTVTQATVTAITPTLAFSSQGDLVYALAPETQQHIQSLIAGKTKQEALHLLYAFPGIEQASIAWADDTTLPKDSKYIHIVVFVM